MCALVRQGHTTFYLRGSIEARVMTSCGLVGEFK